jgi:two-component system, NtrC family, response regulator AtoC
MTKRVLIVDDDQAMCELIATSLGKRGFEVTWRTSADDAFTLMQTEDYDVVISDLNMRGMNGLELCERIVANRPDIPVVVVTAFGSLETAVAAIRAGAYDFITKPFQTDVLRLTLERAIQHHALRAEVTRLRRAVAEAQGPEGLLGNSEAMRRLYDLLDRVAETDATVLITGESGTGKELVARALHARSRRKDGPFVAVNCAAMPEQLLESELFGHVKGAFTDAKSSRTGLFVQASGGVLLLDEIGELPLALQPKLLRALQERRVRPVGADSEVPFDVRLVAATNRDLETAVEERRFRQDLFYRINVISVALPALRARGNDALLLAQHFVQHYASQFGKNVSGISSGAAERLTIYSWPGNVRELQNCMERAVALTRFAQIVVEDLPEKIRSYRRSHVVVATDDPSELVPLEEIERRYILRALDALAGNRTLTAQVLGLDRKTLYRKLRSYGAVTEKEEG